ncbi:MAG: heme-copper oxidase subunit III [Chloroflexi bacterium]|nr:heme-copper oxidase subunit III [Chloroflexota bacterium]
MASQAQEARVTPPHRTQVSRLTINRLGLWLFIVSETFLFAALLSSRYYLQGLQKPDELNQPLGLAITIVLLASSLSAYRAETFSAHGNQRGFERNMLFTLALGAIFIVGVSIEWHEAFKHFPPHTGFGTIFFATTGIHAFHVLSGLIALAIVYGLGRNGRFTRGSYWPVEGAVKYWHFVDVAWVFIYPTLYLVN